MRKLVDYVAQRRITVEVLDRPNCTTEIETDGRLWEHYAYELKVINASEGTEMTIPWRQGIAITQDPGERPELILDCLISDSWSVEQACCFENWAGEYGVDVGSYVQRKLYATLKETAAVFIAFLGGKAELEMLALEYERL